MKVFRPDLNISVTVPFVDLSNIPVTGITQLDYTVDDEMGAEVVASTNIPSFQPDSGEVTITVPAAQNAIGLENFGLRKIEITMVAPAGTFHQSVSYVIESESTLDFLENTFQTYEQAILISRVLTDLPGWSAATEANRKAALSQAYDAVASYSYEFFTSGQDSFPSNFEDIELADWDLITYGQQQDFMKAQVIQADYFLGGSPIEKGIEDGLQSSTIGELSQFYRPRASLNLRVCRGALRYVGRYILWSKSISRT
tara:strand:- start:2786 stop:3553 length:768 start_codon:yes stop_codon:yes gene_type:complete